MNGKYYLAALASGAYHGQGWPGPTVFEVTDAPAYDSNTVWTEIRRESAFFDSKMMPLAAPTLARFIRITHPGTNRGALCELEAFAVSPKRGTIITLR